MSNVSRRTLVQLSALSLAAAPGPRFFTEHEFATLRTLCDCILPADDVSPAASVAGAAEYIDLLSSNNPRLARIFRGGLAWLNAHSQNSVFTAEQTALLDRICDKRKASADDMPGAEFFDWARRLTIDAFYTHPAGYKDVDYRGNHGMAEFAVPQAAIEQALKKANLK